MTAVIATFLTTAIFATQQVYAKNAWDAGYAQGKNDKQDGESHNQRCPDGLTDAQCATYRVGYDAGWISTSIFRPDSEPQREFNYDRDEQNGDDGEFVESDD